MSLVDVSEIVLDPEFAQEFTILRSEGDFVKGRWVEVFGESISMYGVVTIVSARELTFLPEGDRVKGAIMIHTVEPLYLTRAADDSSGTGPGISDKIIWHDDTYKIFKIDYYSDYGYYRAVGERVKGN